MNHFDGLIFDFNGVLLWDTELQEQSWAEFARTLRSEPFTVDEMKRYMHGRTNDYIIRYLTGQTLDAESLYTLSQQKETLYRAMCLQRPEWFKLSPGAVELLDWLVERQIPRTIATGSERVNVAFFVEQLTLATWFDVDKIVMDVGTFPGKPAPDIYQIAASKVDLPPERCIVVEDSLSGIASAQAANIGKIVGMSTSHPAEMLAALPGVDVVIPSFQAFDRSWLA